MALGFEAGGHHTPSNIKPWSLIGDESTIMAATELSSCFERNKVALRMDVLCDDIGPKVCPKGGVGVYNPGFWGMVSDRNLQPKTLSIVLEGKKNLSNATRCHRIIVNELVGCLYCRTLNKEIPIK